jgi:hypothetical protein
VQTITIAIADSLLKAPGATLEGLTREAQVLLAVQFFEMGRLNFGQAAAMCGMARADFLAAAKNYGVPVGDWETL